MPPHRTTSLPLLLGGMTLGGALLLAAAWVPVERVAGGGVTREGWWVAEFGVAVATASLGAFRAWRRTALLAALFVLGAAAQLELTYPKWLQYVEMRPRQLVQGTAPLAVAVLLAQALVVAVAARRRLGGARRTVRPVLGKRVVLGAVLLLLFAGAHGSIFVGDARPPLFQMAAYGAQLAAVAALFVLNLTHLVLLVEAMPTRRLEEFLSRLGEWFSLPGAQRAPTSHDRALPYVVAGLVFVLTAFVAVVAFERLPHIPDGAGYLFHARCFAAGALDAPAPPVPEALSVYLLELRDGRWFCTMNPGWPLILALGELIGAGWLVNPVLAGLSILVVHHLVRSVADCGTAHAAALLVATSPWYLFLGGSFMNHTLTLTLLLGAWALLARWYRTRSPVPIALAGVLLGYLVTVRSLDGVVAGTLTGAWLLIGRPLRWREALVFAAGCLAGSVWLLEYNAQFTGDPLRFPLNEYFDRVWYPGANRLGFGADVGNPPNRWVQLDALPGHGPIDVALNSNQNLYNLNFELFGWATGSLWLAVAHFVLGRLSRADRCLILFTAALWCGYSLYWFSGGPDFGARYWFLLFAPCVWWTVRGARTLAGVCRERLGLPEAARRVGVALGVLAGTAVIVFVPWRIVSRYVGYRDVHGDLRALAAGGALDDALVLVKTDSEAEFLAAFSLNSPFLGPGAPVFARDLGPETTARLRDAFPDREVVRVLGRTVSPDGRTVIVPEGQ